MKIAEPLPECALCETPTRRATHERNHGLCTNCATGINATVRMLPVRDIDDLTARRALRDQRAADDAQTVFVERFMPPVPPQRPGAPDA